MEKTTEELTIENENLKKGNIKVWEQLEKSTEILSHHEAYISLLEEENTKLKELLHENRQKMFEAEKNYGFDDSIIDILTPQMEKIDEFLGDKTDVQS